MLRAPARILLLGTLSACAGVRYAEPQALPVVEVSLFQNGEAHLIRRGSAIEGRLRLDVPATQLDQVRRSLTVISDPGDRPLPVRFPIQEMQSGLSGDKGPSAAPIRGILGLLRRSRGAQVKLGGWRIRTRGRVVGLEPTERIVEERTIKDHRLTLDMGEGQLESFVVSDLESVTLEDPDRVAALERSLDASLHQKRAGPTSLWVPLGGLQPRVLVSYVLSARAWTPNYRLMLNPSGASLRLWANIRNTSGVDWRDVRLSLWETPASERSYTPTKPVTLRDGYAALIPVARPRVKVENIVLIERERAQRAMLVSNLSNRVLGRGAVTLFVQDRFVGTSTLARISPGARGLVKLGEERAVTATTTRSTFSSLRPVRAELDALRCEVKTRWVTKTRIDNTLAAPRVAWLELEAEEDAARVSLVEGRRYVPVPLVPGQTVIDARTRNASSMVSLGVDDEADRARMSELLQAELAQATSPTKRALTRALSLLKRLPDKRASAGFWRILKTLY